MVKKELIGQTIINVGTVRVNWNATLRQIRQIPQSVRDWRRCTVCASTCLYMYSSKDRLKFEHAPALRIFVHSLLLFFNIANTSVKKRTCAQQDGQLELDLSQHRYMYAQRTRRAILQLAQSALSQVATVQLRLCWKIVNKLFARVFVRMKR
jgi:hypothetical protein